MHPPESAVRLPGTLWGIAAYFNPAGYESKLRNYRLFRDASKKQGLQLIVAEAAFGSAPHELADTDADVVLRLRTDAVLWQKERLLNIATAHLPRNCDKVVAIDTDVLLEQDDWIRDTSALLERFAVVQPFAEAIQLQPHHVQAVETNSRDRSIACAWATTLPETFTFYGHPGYACAMRREIIDRFGMYDRAILGNGDTIFMTACMGIPPEQNPYIRHHSAAVFADIEPWFQQVRNSVNGSVSFTLGRLLHLWHGNRNKRMYHDRAFLLRDYDPGKDIRKNDDGCFEWATDKKELQENIRRYFRSRDEDGN